MTGVEPIPIREREVAAARGEQGEEGEHHSQGAWDAEDSPR